MCYPTFERTFACSKIAMLGSSRTRLLGLSTTRKSIADGGIASIVGTLVGLSAPRMAYMNTCGSTMLGMNFLQRCLLRLSRLRRAH
jgi:hypothetical protein